MLTYLASPYSHPDPAVMERRYEAACKAAGYLMKQGECVFAPIAHSHRIGQLLGQSTDHTFWLKQDFAILDKCDEMIVLMLDGWNHSFGVAEEIKRCKEHNKQVRYLFPADLGVDV
jgi:Domain of unknown function (DUF1937)